MAQRHETRQRVYDWPGGALRIVRRDHVALDFSDPASFTLLEDEDLGVEECIPFGHGLALRVGKRLRLGVELGVSNRYAGIEVELGVVEGRLELVGMWALEGRALTPEILRAPVRKLVRELAPFSTVRVVRSETGETVGETWDSVLVSVSGGGVDIRGDHLDEEALAELEGSRARGGAQQARRRSLSDAFLAEVAETYREAVAQGRSTHKAIRDRWPTSPGNARRWVLHARRRGLLGEALGPLRAGEAGAAEQRGGQKDG